MSENKKPISLDIDNFEVILSSKKYRGGVKFVLTSPRSLSACDKLNIKPIELLPLKLLQKPGQETNEIESSELELARQSIFRIESFI
jgi:hypothetical protein